MSSVTAVPLRPVSKGSLATLWLGIAVLLLCALYLGWRGIESTVQRETTASGLQYRILTPGEGDAHPTTEDVALVGYKGMLADGTVFDQQERAPVEVAKVIPGWTEGLQLMTKGAKYRFWIPAKLAYGEKGAGDGVIPPNADLTFDVHLIDFIPASVLQQQMQLQQMQQHGAMGGAGGAGLGGIPGH